jgi:hypothetical protein
MLILLYSGMNLTSTFLYMLYEILGNNNNSIANYIFCLTKNQPQDGSQLEPKHVV